MAALLLSGMQPVRFWIEKLCLEASADYANTEIFRPIPGITLKLSLQRAADNVGTIGYKVSLAISSPGRADDNSPMPYSLDAIATGYFAAPREAEVEITELRRLAAFNGAAIVYGFVRDCVLQLSSFGLHGPFMLPAVNLAAIADEVLAQPETELPRENLAINSPPASEEGPSIRRSRRRARSGKPAGGG